MPFNCENPSGTTQCLSYTVAYLQNLEYVSNGLLSIINNLILANLDETTPVDITNADCTCTAGLPTANKEVFNCVLWRDIKDLLIVGSEDNDNTGYLAVLSQTLKCILENTQSINHGFASQIERFICISESLATRIDAISCTNNCPEVIGDLLCLLIQLLTRLISSVSKFAALYQYSTPRSQTPGTLCSQRDLAVINSFFECMVCDFVNDLCELEKFISELSSIIIEFATCDLANCTPCYTATCAPKKTRPICPPHIMQNGNSYGYGHGNYNGYNNNGCCGCKKR